MTSLSEEMVSVIPRQEAAEDKVAIMEMGVPQEPGQIMQIKA